MDVLDLLKRKLVITKDALSILEIEFKDKNTLLGRPRGRLIL
jgi:hypothetical protein